MDEKYLELLADYAARQIAAQREKVASAPKLEREARVKQAKHSSALLKSAKRSAAVNDAYRHALLLALSGRSEYQLTAE